MGGGTETGACKVRLLNALIPASTDGAHRNGEVSEWNSRILEI